MKNYFDHFTFYVAFREQKKRGKRKRGHEKDKKFNLSEWTRIAEAVKNRSSQQQSGTSGLSMLEILEPKNGVGYNVMNTTKAALKQFWKRQREQGINTHSEEEVFGVSFEQLIDHVQKRKPRMDRKNCIEKIDKDSAPMEAVHHIGTIEESFFKIGIDKRDNRSVHASLRNRFMFLATMCGVLRGESVIKAELSDLLRITRKNPEDPHQLFVLILQIPTGKTNRGYKKLFGRMARNFDVEVCPVGALGFYLMFRFHHSQEMNNNTDSPIDFCENDSWFYIKLLTEFNTDENTKCLQDGCYAKEIKRICIEEKIPTSHYLHIGRVLGAYECELNEDHRADISNLGNWGLNTQEARYSTKLPMKIIRSKAHLQKGINWNPRISLPVPDNLREKVFPWLHERKEQFDEDERSADCQTARCFLNLLDELQSIVIQDAAAITIRFPERLNHGLFQLPVFQTDIFLNYRNDMKGLLERSTAPWDSSLEQVLPGVNARLNGIQTSISANTMLLERAVNFSPRIEEQMNSMPHIIDRNMRVFFAGMLQGAHNATVLQNQWRQHERLVNGSRPTASTAGSSGSPTSNRSSNAQNLPQHETYPGYGYKLPTSIKSAQSLWNAWHGLGSFKDRPIQGGIEKLINEKGKDWRKNYKPHEHRMFSRWRTSIMYMKEEFRNRNDIQDIGEFLKEMDNLLDSNKKWAITPFYDAVRKRKKALETHNIV